MVNCDAQTHVLLAELTPANIEEPIHDPWR